MPLYPQKFEEILHVTEYSIKFQQVYVGERTDCLHHGLIGSFECLQAETAESGGYYPGPSQILTSLPSNGSTGSTASRRQQISKIYTILATLSSHCYHHEGVTGALESFAPDIRTVYSHQSLGF